MRDEIVVYSIKLYEIGICPFLFFFTRKCKQEIEYSISYRIAEDRFWFKRRVLEYDIFGYPKVISEEGHHTKNNLTQSIAIIKGIEERLTDLSKLSDPPMEVYRLSESRSTVYELIAAISKDIRRVPPPDSWRTGQPSELHPMLLGDKE